ncbi:hypothetical protein BH23BAC1_BH23BAC1_37610 [soil metagenome]
MGVDFDPQTVRNWQELGKTILYGDIEDPDILEQIPFQNAKCVISTIPDREHSEKLIKTLRKNDYKGQIFLTALHERDVELLNDCEVDQILMPHNMAAENFYNSYLTKLLPQKM